MIRDKDLLRADRVFTLYFVRPLLCRSLSRDSSSVPILMYHQYLRRRGEEPFALLSDQYKPLSFFSSRCASWIATDMLA